MTTDSRDAITIDARLKETFALLHVEAASGHPSEDDWARFAADELSPADRTQLADHVVSCAECAGIFRVVSLVVADAAVGRSAAERRPSFGDWRLLAAAAAALLTIGLSVWWVVRPRIDDNDTQRAAGAAPVASPAADPAAAPPSAWASLPSAPEVRLPPDLILTMRGTGAEREAFLQAFGAAITPYRAGRFAEAASALAPVAERYSDVVETWFYLGTARLYSGAPHEAIEPLRRARSSELVGDEARWLEVLALERAGHPSEARAELEVLCAEPGNYRVRACAVVKP